MPMSSLYRVGCVYKHYAELGNTWAVKPRFVLAEDGLSLVERPASVRADLANSRKHSEHYRTYDAYTDVFHRMTPEGKRCYLLHFLRNRHAALELISGLNKGSQTRLTRVLSAFAISVLKRFGKRPYQPHKQPTTLISLTQSEQGRLFGKICRSFYDLSLERGSFPIIVVTSQGWTNKYPDIYREAVKNLRTLCREESIDLQDFGEQLLQLDSHEAKLYSAESVHLSPSGNRFLAAWLANEIKALVRDGKATYSGRF